MALIDYQITEADVNRVNVQSADTVLKGSAQENKRIFDNFPDMIVQKFNAFVREVASQSTNEIDAEVIAQFENAGWVMPLSEQE